MKVMLYKHSFYVNKLDDETKTYKEELYEIVTMSTRRPNTNKYPISVITYNGYTAIEVEV